MSVNFSNLRQVILQATSGGVQDIATLNTKISQIFADGKIDRAEAAELELAPKEYDLSNQADVEQFKTDLAAIRANTARPIMIGPKSAMGDLVRPSGNEEKTGGSGQLTEVPTKIVKKEILNRQGHTDMVTFDPAKNRITIRLTDGQGAEIGKYNYDETFDTPEEALAQYNAILQNSGKKVNHPKEEVENVEIRFSKTGNPDKCNVSFYPTSQIVYFGLSDGQGGTTRMTQKRFKTIDEAREVYNKLKNGEVESIIDKDENGHYHFIN